MDRQRHDLGIFPSDLRGRRILLCTESFGPVNGVSRTTLMLVNHLRSNGAQVAVAAPYNHTKKDIFIPTATGENDPRAYCPEIRLKGYPLPFNPELSIVYPVRLSELYRRTFGGRPDLIYLASPASLGFQVLLQLRQQPEDQQIPIICNFQTDLAGYCEILFPFPLGPFAGVVFAKVQGYLFRHSSVQTLFYPSTSIRRYLENVAEVQQDKLSILQRGVDTQGFHPGKRNTSLRKAWAPNGELVLFTCSRLADEKGYDFLARATSELAKTKLNFKLVIVGGNRNTVVEQGIKARFKKLAENGKVIFTGMIVGEALMEHYASADIFLHCSITETFGLVVLEAMASGVPVIARDEGGPSDIISHGRNGFLVPPNDVAGFVQKTTTLGHDVELRRQFSELSRAHALEATWEKIGNKVAWTMTDIIREDKTSRREQITPGTTRAHIPIFAWVFLSSAIKQAIASTMVNVKLMLALATIAGFWGGVGLYLAFIETTHWIKTRFSRR
ncbi:glycosyl transferase group 1 [Xylariaceae sp. FL1272]|nr:glycosyl transferase group 1 [Xylariaceae sp. FL1272]